MPENCGSGETAPQTSSWSLSPTGARHSSNTWVDLLHLDFCATRGDSFLQRLDS